MTSKGFSRFGMILVASEGLSEEKVSPDHLRLCQSKLPSVPRCPFLLPALSRRTRTVFVLSKQTRALGRCCSGTRTWVQALTVSLATALPPPGLLLPNLSWVLRSWTSRPCRGELTLRGPATWVFSVPPGSLLGPYPLWFRASHCSSLF